MNLLDLGIVALLALITFRGYYRGLFQELAVLAGVVGGLFLSLDWLRDASGLKARARWNRDFIRRSNCPSSVQQ